jgi:hypothetical protein
MHAQQLLKIITVIIHVSLILLLTWFQIMIIALLPGWTQTLLPSLHVDPNQLTKDLVFLIQIASGTKERLLLLILNSNNQLPSYSKATSATQQPLKTGIWMLQPVFLNTPNLVVNRKDACGLLVLQLFHHTTSAMFQRSLKMQLLTALAKTWLLQVNV